MAHTIWLTGLSGAGKTTLAKHLKNNHLLYSVIIDGDELRKNINADLGMSSEDRTKNITRAAEICKLINDGGHNVIACLTSPLEAQRQLAEEIIGPNNFFLVYVACDLETVCQRDPKGLYQMYIDGKIVNMVGIDLPYEVPLKPNIVVNTAAFDLIKCSDLISKSYTNYVANEHKNGHFSKI